MPARAPHPSAPKQMIAMTAYLGFCAFGYQALLKTNISQDILEGVLILLLSLGLMYPAWRYGIFSPALGTYVGWVILGVTAAYTLG
ncbi:MAG: hypothetical protein COA85_08240 [Robiginitomaculum sp.]|nr:MAG: hypothetical protein COA85_08240 [Robiginitomaculum sp.]